MALNPMDTELSMDLAENNTLAMPLSDQGFSLMVCPCSRLWCTSEDTTRRVLTYISLLILISLRIFGLF